MKEVEGRGQWVPTKREAEALDTAALYSRFPDIQSATEKMKEVAKEGEYEKGFVAEMTSLLENVAKGAEILELSLSNQKEYGLVDKRWVRKLDYMREALEKGRRALELDLRVDKDGTFWVSHATGGKSKALPPFIHEMTTEEMKEAGERFTVEEAFEVFSEYKDRGHKLILELKTLGSDEAQFSEAFESLLALIREHELEDSVAISSLSPGLLMTAHESAPSIPLILNGGVVPCVSYEKKYEEQDVVDKSLNAIAKYLMPADGKWRAYAAQLPILGKIVEIVMSASEKSVRRPDGEGTFTAYAFARLPEDLVEAFKKQMAEGHEFGGMVSLSTVTILASTLETLGATTKAEELRRYYADVIDKLGLGKMATTWGQGFSKIPVLGKTVFSHLTPQEQIKAFRKLGVDVIYTAAPEEFAHTLPPKITGEDPSKFVQIYSEKE
jgi:glycerophosphoryl diester phosphodiesterase